MPRVEGPPEPWRSFFADVDARLREETHLHCCGGFVVTQLYGVGRTTSDVDFLGVVPSVWRCKAGALWCGIDYWDGHGRFSTAGRQQSGRSMPPIIPILVALASGGLMGAIFTQYWTNRQTVVSYSINTTSLGAAETTRSILPSLRIQLGNIEIPVVYTHTIELRQSGGPELEQAKVAVTLKGGALLGDVLASGPDPVHQIICTRFEQSSSSLVCTLGRISANNGPYRIVMATDKDPSIVLTIDGKNARIQEQDASANTAVAEFLKALGVCFLAVIALFVIAFLRGKISVEK
jgi:hypothetical protein